MKRSALLLVFMAALTMSGCLVSSLHPFYKMKDKIFDKTLIGTWIEEGDSSFWVIEENEISTGFMNPSRPDSTYKIKYYQEDGISILKGTLFVLDGKNYVDFFPDPEEEHCTPEMTAYHHIPVHTLARLKITPDSLMFFWYGEEWLNELFENNRVRIAHETIEVSSDYTTNVLTASTSDLQKFIRKYMNDPSVTELIDKAFNNDIDDVDEHAFLKLYPYDGPIPTK